MTMIRKRKNIAILLLQFVLASGVFYSCNDVDTSNYYTFTGEMMSEYLESREQYSDFTAILKRADLFEPLSVYGHYTCFAPNNDAFDVYLSEKGLNSIEELTDEDCDTIARTHLVKNIYEVADMADGTLTTANMNRCYIEITHGVDSNMNAVVYLNRSAHILFATQDEEVENGIVQPVSGVLKSSSRMLPDVMADNPTISIFNEALRRTKLIDSLYAYIDPTYNPKAYERVKYTSHVNRETATAPDEKKQGFTAFVPTDKVLFEKYGITDWKGLYEKAAEIYGAVYEDAGASYYDTIPEALAHRKNPLNRLVAYHILDRDVIGWNLLTPRNDIGIQTTVMNPIDWYETMLPQTMIRVEKLTVLKYGYGSTVGERYINRRCDDEYQVKGAMISQTVENEYANSAINGRYFYVDDLLAFSETTRDVVHNCRIRMDMATIFPELMTMNIRQNGTDPSVNDPEYDETGKYGRNYYFPDGYLKNVKVNGLFVYRRPHNFYDSYEGDEMNMFGNYDITFKLPPVPYEGEWQIRLGYAAEPTRGIAQVYFGDDPNAMEPQGIPLDMTKTLDDPSILGADWVANYNTMSQQNLAADQKALKNKGYYRGAAGGYRYDMGTTNRVIFATQLRTFRRVLCTVHINPEKDHYLRVRSVSSKKGNDNEFMLDYIELVPKSVYGVTDEGAMEDML